MPIWNDSLTMLVAWNDDGLQLPHVSWCCDSQCDTARPKLVEQYSGTVGYANRVTTSDSLEWAASGPDGREFYPTKMEIEPSRIEFEHSNQDLTSNNGDVSQQKITSRTPAFGLKYWCSMALMFKHNLPKFLEWVETTKKALQWLFVMSDQTRF